MTEEQYDLLKSISKLGDLDATQIDYSLKMELVKLKLIEQYPAGKYRMSRKGERDYKKEKLRRKTEWWKNNWKWIVGVLGLIVSIIGLLIMTK